jgi:hypothetical protein
MTEQAYELYLEREIPGKKRPAKWKLIHDGALPEGVAVGEVLTLRGEQWTVAKIKPTKIYMRFDAKTLRPVPAPSEELNA